MAGRVNLSDMDSDGMMSGEEGEVIDQGLSKAPAKRKKNSSGQIGETADTYKISRASKRSARRTDSKPMCESDVVEKQRPQTPGALECAPQTPSSSGPFPAALPTPPSSSHSSVPSTPQFLDETSPSTPSAAPAYNAASPPLYRPLRARPFTFRRVASPVVRRNAANGRPPVKVGRVSKELGHLSHKQLLKRLRGGSTSKKQDKRIHQLEVIFGETFVEILGRVEVQENKVAEVVRCNNISEERMQQIIEAGVVAAIKTMQGEERAAADAAQQRRAAARAKATFWERRWADMLDYGPGLVRSAQAVEAVSRISGRLDGARRWMMNRL